jgi:cytochrome b
MHRIAERVFWGFMLGMLVLGVVAAVLSWGVLKPDARSWTAWTPGIGV